MYANHVHTQITLAMQAFVRIERKRKNYVFLFFCLSCSFVLLLNNFSKPGMCTWLKPTSPELYTGW